MSSSTAALSRTLQNITLTKIRELEKQRKAYAQSKNAVLAAAKKVDDNPRAKIAILLKGVEELNPSASSEIDLSNIRRWLEQSHFDSTIPETTLHQFEEQLRSQLHVQTRRLDLVALYSRLLTDWLNPTEPTDDQVSLEDSEALDGSFEVVEKDRLKQLKDKFSAVVFEPLETDEIEISLHLEALFSEDVGVKALERLRRDIGRMGTYIRDNKAPFDDRTIRWCLKGLLANDLLREDKKAILQDFLCDEVARTEICDVLNMKMADIKNWQWDAGEEGLPVEPRRQLNGKYRIMMDEDILDAIFLHYVGMTWNVGVKTILCDVARYTGIWKHKVNVSEDVHDRRRYFLGDYRSRAETHTGVEKGRLDMYRDDFFLSQLPSTVWAGAGGYDDDEEIDPDSEGQGQKSPKEVKQQLLRLLATEVQLQKTLHGRVAVVQSDFQWFCTGLSHSTLFALLRFCGVDEEWIAFFKKFLEAPLNMGPVSEGEANSDRVQIRKRGVPMAHALEKFFGELVLYFMDLAVNQEASMLLYRFHDDLYLVGQPEKCAVAWQSMERYSALMGLELNKSKTGSVLLSGDDFTYEDSEIAAKLPTGAVSIGFLSLDAESGDWVINQKDVFAHVKQLSKQLAAAPSILSWVHTWNSCIGRFFSHTFGVPANCFGKAHVDAILDTYKHMQEFLFPGSNVCAYLKSLIEERFGVSDVPDAFIFLPEALGGLGVRNPFIDPFLVRDKVCKSSAGRMKKFLKDEDEAYNSAKTEFEELTEQDKKRRLRAIYKDSYGESSISPDLEKSLETFMSKEEFVAHRESTSAELAKVYEELMDVPKKKRIVTSSRVGKTIQKLEEGMSDSGIEGRSELEWLLQFYERELLEKCGGMTIVEKNLLPLGILTILRKKKVAWQMVL
ncbi:hypothetical protein N431DRAFT_431187 [Stipitochalara longipes BDJ]|nr:hypothetical protein N431DRAFT_431187 [Stipitochalara longipes BDJ]